MREPEKKESAVTRYLRERTILFTLRLNKQYDEDIIKHLKKQKNKSGYVKLLIRNDMNKSVQ